MKVCGKPRAHGHTVYRRLSAMAALGALLKLWSADTMVTFIVCRAGGPVIWQNLLPEETVFDSGSASGETSTRYPIWSARQVRAGCGAEWATLYLTLARSRGIDVKTFAAPVLDVAIDPMHSPGAEQCNRRDAIDWYATDLGDLLHHHQDSA
ncbi:hypothetical protein AB0B25_08000 [Nocardia sp. NPDC049190]|uniref:hypothetical protein n=1 Tax=Nocardia sp. NPDC049190 TaxID=3155650 RepID=UPI0033C2E936